MFLDHLKKLIILKFLVLLTFFQIIAENGENLIKVIDIYNNSKGVVIDLNRETIMTLLDQKKKVDGKMYISKSKVRVDMEEPENTSFILGKDLTWMIQKLPMVVDGKKWQVTKVDTKKLKQQKGSVLPLLFGEKKLWKAYNITITKESKNIKTYHLIAKDKENPTGTKYIDITINHDRNKIQSIEYLDEIDNKVNYTFKTVKLNESINPSKFKYTPPKDAMVTEY